MTPIFSLDACRTINAVHCAQPVTAATSAPMSPARNFRRPSNALIRTTASRVFKGRHRIFRSKARAAFAPNVKGSTGFSYPVCAANRVMREPKLRSETPVAYSQRTDRGNSSCRRVAAKVRICFPGELGLWWRRRDYSARIPAPRPSGCRCATFGSAPGAARRTRNADSQPHRRKRKKVSTRLTLFVWWRRRLCYQ